MQLRLALVALSLGPAAAHAQSIRVLTFNETREGVCAGSFSTNFTTGNAFQAVREALLSSSTATTLGRSVTLLPSVGRMDAANLEGADVVLISTAAVDCQEITALHQFVRQGGGLFYFGNNAALSMAAGFGGEAGQMGTVCASVIPGAGPVVDGPFGAATGCVCPAFHLRFVSVGAGTAFLSDGSPVGAVYTAESGRAVLLCDEEWAMSATLSGCAAGTLNANNLTLFLNAFAFIAPAAPVVFEAPNCYPDCDCSTTPPSLNVADFTCFLQRFAAADPYANCDQSTTAPVLNVADFSCFLQSFAAGCP